MPAPSHAPSPLVNQTIPPPPISARNRPLTGARQIVKALGAFRPDDGDFVPGAPGCPLSALTAMLDAAKEVGGDVESAVAACGRGMLPCARGCINCVEPRRWTLSLVPGTHGGLQECLSGGIPVPFGSGCQHCSGSSVVSDGVGWAGWFGLNDLSCV